MNILVPVIERAMERRDVGVYAAIDQLRGEVQATIEVMDGNDQAIISALQEIRGQVTGDGAQVAEVLKLAAESWERFVRGEAEKLGLKVIVPKGERDGG